MKPESAVVSITVNGTPHRLEADTRRTLVDLLREDLGLTGTKIGCGQGTCGACTVHVDGVRVLACLLLAVTVEGGQVLTIEGLGTPDGGLHELQQAFIDRDALQCGFCTPGQIMSGLGCIGEGRANTAEEIRESMSGNLCRCAAYPGIVAAIADVAEGQGA
ncbi:(2Fe-2S)-binding protein [Nonomuraea lactucae]|uniref:(2Fe-2S)-binding protein n=1 Tax=Nonomuraea lactucae TaxID=2249762 RepID=UPI000DE21CE1|nr:(2Fe-2S)-binding protein [Nonomuraea lactucae]